MKKWLGLLLAVVIVAGVVFWWGSLHDANAPGSESGQQDTSQSGTVAELISYTLPTGWEEATCPGGSNGQIYVVPQDAKLDCAADPKAPISLLVDPRQTKDCQHVTAPNGVLSHTCKSLFIDGHKTILASTEYPKSDLYPKAETITDYFVDTGKGVVQIEYVFGRKGTNTYQTGFEQLVQSVKVR